ncbi:MAG TPA: phosphate signaling complex protein PhoU [Victivallales bacterium]|nr:phosphate signaling complex protein PhoU [Victivallales bacterium]HRU00688.1 phosphate signaling complex protein PhoU [Victivallales bacterium]
MSVHLDREIEKIKKMLVHLATIVEENVRKSVLSVSSRNEDLARKIITADDIVDKLEVELEEECLKVLALHQPLAADLRYVIACLKINNDLERIGDLAVNIAQRAIAIAENKEDKVPIDFSAIMEKTQQMLSLAIEATIELNPTIANQVCVMEKEIDEFNKEIHNEIIKLIKDKPKKTKYFLHILGVSRQLERIADYATNICEDVIYMIEGKIIRHQM